MPMHADVPFPAPITTTSQTVIEYVMLLRIRSDVDPGAVQDMLDAAWSLQYIAPAIMCASVGAVATQRTYAGHDVNSSWSSTQFTHAVHFRVAQRKSFDALLQHPLHTALLLETIAPLVVNEGGAAPGVLRMAFEGCIAKEIEGMFRRGGEYAEGTELLLLFVTPGSSSGGGGGGGAAAAGGGAVESSTAAHQAHSFLARLASLAESAAAGALQASAGQAVSCSRGGGAGEPPGQLPSHVLMARFPLRAQADAFLNTPPCVAAAAGDARLPLHAVAAFALQVEPGDEGVTRVTPV